MKFQLFLKESELKAFGYKCASLIPQHPPFVFLIRGDLGSGKTTFVKHLIQGLTSKNTKVTSPTFTLVNIYDSAKGQIWHADLYRLQNPSELEETGLIEALYANICLVEWPEMLDPYLVSDYLDLSIKIGNDDARCFTFSARGKEYEQYLTKLFEVKKDIS